MSPVIPHCLASGVFARMGVALYARMAATYAGANMVAS
jgi:hypothetical protein